MHNCTKMWQLRHVDEPLTATVLNIAPHISASLAGAKAAQSCEHLTWLGTARPDMYKDRPRLQHKADK